MHPTNEEMQANRLKQIPVGATVRLVDGMYNLLTGDIGYVTKTYLSGAKYQCSIVNFPSVSGQAFPNYLLEELNPTPDWEV
jgi:hypothetical protein